MKVWIVTSGSYSMYQVRWVVDNELLAKKLSEKLDDGDYEEFEVRSGVPDHHVVWDGSQHILLIDDGALRIEVGEPFINRRVLWGFDDEYVMAASDIGSTEKRALQPGTNHFNVWGHARTKREVQAHLKKEVAALKRMYGL